MGSLRFVALSYAKIVLAHLAAVLKPRGFRKSGQTFIRQVDDCFLIVNLQASQFGTGQYQRYTINLSVYCDQLKPREKDPLKLKEYEGQWRARIHAFRSDRRSQWWEVRSDSDAEKAGLEMAQELPIALEAMEGISTYEGLINIPPGVGAGSDDPPGWCVWPIINAAREREGLPPSVGLEPTDGWRSSWHRRRFPDAE